MTSRPGPIRRAYTTSSGRRKDVDAFERAIRFRVFGWSLVGAFLGALLGGFLSARRSGGVLTILTCTALGWAIAFFGPLWLGSVSGRAAGTLYAPSGRSTPRRREYSLAESHLARGDPEGAMQAFEAAVAEDPGDSAPYLRIARIRRDRTDDLDGAFRWFRRALSDAEMSPALRHLVLREIVELCEGRLDEPLRAAPLLARAAAELEGSAEGAWAEETLRRIKASPRDGVNGAGEGDGPSGQGFPAP